MRTKTILEDYCMRDTVVTATGNRASDHELKQISFDEISHEIEKVYEGIDTIEYDTQPEYGLSEDIHQVVGTLNGLLMTEEAERKFVVQGLGLNYKARTIMVEHARDQWVTIVNTLLRSRAHMTQVKTPVTKAIGFVRHGVIENMAPKESLGFRDDDLLTTVVDHVTSNYSDQVFSDRYNIGLDFSASSFYMPATHTGEVVKGDVVHGGLVVENSYLFPDKLTAGGPTIRLYTYRLQCLNGMIGGGEADRFLINDPDLMHMTFGDRVRLAVDRALGRYEQEMENSRQLAQIAVDHPSRVLRDLRSNLKSY